MPRQPARIPSHEGAMRSLSDEHIQREVNEQQGLSKDPLDVLLILEEVIEGDFTDERLIITVRRYGLIEI